jgi:hypothetical protein
MNFMHIMVFKGKLGRSASNKLINNILHCTLNPSTSYITQINDSKFIHLSIPSSPPMFNTFDHINMQWEGWKKQHIPMFDAMVVIVICWLLETSGYSRLSVTVRRPCIVLLNSPYFLFCKNVIAWVGPSSFNAN